MEPSWPRAAAHGAGDCARRPLAQASGADDRGMGRGTPRKKPGLAIYRAVPRISTST
jgi:hypothetical protein